MAKIRHFGTKSFTRSAPLPVTCDKRYMQPSSRYIQISAVSLAMLLMPVAGFAGSSVNCNQPSSNNSSCTIPSGTYTKTTKLSGSGNNAGDDGPNYTLTNNGTIDINDQNFGLVLASSGEDGSGSTPDGGAGGDLQLDNYGAITIAVTESSTIYGLYALSKGGDGHEPDDNGADGGRGGDGGNIADGSTGSAAIAVGITNTATITLNQNLQDGGIGIYAETDAGAGGNQNSSVFGDQGGGSSGDAKDISISNSGAILFGSASSYLKANEEAWGIAAWSEGNNGGSNNGNGGTGGNITIGNSGEIALYLDGKGGLPGGLRGINALSEGGNGLATSDNSDDGGKGEAGYQIQITNSGSIGLYDEEDSDGLSAGIVSLTEGGNGGGAPTSGKGGAGGNASDTTGGAAGLSSIQLNNGSDIFTDGEDILGAVLSSQGGNGGNGTDGDNGSSGGNGGAGGAIAIALTGNAQIFTADDGSYGVLGQSVGGSGGSGGDNTALLGQGGSAGYGGDGGTASFSAGSGTNIVTNGVFSSAVAIQSIGGNGGVAGNFVAVLGGAGGDGGNGGNSGSVSVTTAGVLQTYGDFSHAILAQSISGSGGDGDIPVGSFSLGGDGGSGGNGGSVTVINSSRIITTGFVSRGIIAQSISGGGGDAGTLGGGFISVGGDSGIGGTAGQVSVTHSGSISTQGAAATGILAQSIGGGGGSAGGDAGIFSVGGSGAGGGNGSTVNVALQGTINTAGAWANGITAQSIGGGGGDGGNVFDFSVLIPTIGVGGSGGVPGTSSDVTVGNYDSGDNTYSGAPSIATTGDHAYGVLAQSIGGGGGSGGSVFSAGLVDFFGLQIGGDPADGADGNDVTVQFQNLTLATAGSDGNGIVAQSIGGGGGVGGNAFGGTISPGFSSDVAIGGSGGTGGNGDTVTIDLTDSTITTGADASTADPVTDSIGILAQSVGGGGGIGGHAFSAALAAGVGPELPLVLATTLSIGGSGGAGGNGGDVTVDLSGNTAINTTGASSDGILAESIGGGGGHAGMGWTYAVGEGLGGTAVVGGVGVSLGGDGGASGNGGTVTIGLNDSASIITNGKDADGINAQSVGGGGGDAGAASTGATGSAGVTGFTVKTALGGAGGGGGDGGVVEVDLARDSSILTMGGDSQGIIAQSVGGGGGTSQGDTAGGTVRAGDEVLGGATLQANLSVGLQGGTGGDGDAVTVNDDGTITTQATGSLGIIAQSIGGGGGVGGSVAADTTVSGSAVAFYYQAYELGIGIGGSGGDGGNGAAVTLNQSGKITTLGDFATGVFAQSVGGGGGMGGSAVTSYGIFHPTAAVDLTVGGTGGSGGAGQTVFGNFTGASISTAGYMADGAVLQSVGGGGGLGADASDSAQGFFVVGGEIGGGGGSGNGGGKVGVTGSSLTVNTTGSDAIGLVAQSVGGGGGIGGQGNATASINPAIQAISLELAVGGSGGDAGDGGQVQVGSSSTPFDANINTDGDRAYGLLAQSVGGGGGIGGAGSANNYTSVTLGGQSGATGNGGDVSVYTSSDSMIETGGAGAMGLVAQSVGGGGGIAGDVSTPGISFSLGDPKVSGQGNGGNVLVDSNGYVQVSGTDAFGIFAQSVGGGGGFGGDAERSFAGSLGTGNAKGSGGAVTVNQQGTVIAVGTGGVGIFAQSQGPSGGGKISVNVMGAVIGNLNGGAGVEISGGHLNALTDASGSYVSGSSGGGGTAIIYQGRGSTDDGSVLYVDNEGDIEGSVLLTNSDGDTAGVVNNSYHMNSQLVEANVVNRGRFIVGNADPLGSSRVTGDFEQTNTGILQLDSDFAGGHTSQLEIDGNAQLAGHVAVETQTLLPRALAFLQVGGTASGSLEGTPSGPFNYNISQTGNAYTVVPVAQFNQPSFDLTTGEAQAAGELQSLWNAGGGNFSPLFSAINNAGTASYARALAALNTDTVDAPAAQNLALTQDRLDRLMSCPTFMQDSAMVVQTQCVWAQISGHAFGQGAFDGSNGYSDSTQAYTIGGQKQVAPNWFVGGATSYENSNILASGGGFNSSGQMFSAGATVKHEIGNWLLAGAMDGNIGSFSNTRIAVIDGLGGQATSDQNIDGLGWRLRAAYTWVPATSVYIKPYVDLDMVYSRAGAYSESGAKLLDQQVADSTKWAVLGSPSVELGRRFDIGTDYVLRGYANAGMTVSSAHEWSAQVRLSAAPGADDGYTVSLPMDTIYGRVGAGLQLASTKNGLNLRLEYDGMFGAHSTQNGGSLRLTWAF